VVDGPNNQVYGTYDFGNGVQVTPAFSVTPAQIAELNTIDIGIDHRYGAGYTGAAYDNISVDHACFLRTGVEYSFESGQHAG